MSPTLHTPIGLAYVANDRERAVGSEIQIEIRGRATPARLSLFRFTLTGPNAGNGLATLG